MTKSVDPGCIGFTLIAIGLFVLTAIASALADISQTLTRISERI